MASNIRFEEEIPEVLLAYPSLYVKEIADIKILAGQISIYTDENEHIDTYEIEIHPTDNYPGQYPFVYEVGGRLPHNIDWHVYNDGHWCICVPVEEMFNCRNGITLVDFISKQICPYLFNQTYRKNNGVFYRERSHGVLGALEFYKEHFKLSDLKQAVLALQAAASKEPKSNSKCFCESNKKYHKCHRRTVRLLRKNAQAAMLNDYNKLKDILSNKSK